RLDGEFLICLDEFFDNTSSSAGLFIAQRNACHSFQGFLRKVVNVARVVKSLLDQGVLEHPVAHTTSAKLIAKVRDLLNRETRVVDKYRRTHRFKALADALHSRFFFSANHLVSSSGIVETLEVSTRTPGPIVLETVTLLR